MRRLGRNVSRQTVKIVLVEAGLSPEPHDHPDAWSDFLKRHAETLWQCDFFSKNVWTFQGPRQIFALAFIHLATRRVFVTPGTFQPDAAWVERQARTFLDHAAAENLACSILTRDFDGKFSQPFVQVFKDRSIQVKKVGPQAPNLNAFIERWIQSMQQEALDHFIVLGERHFDHIVGEYVAYYHERRPHQGVGNVLLPRLPCGPADGTTFDDEGAFRPLALADVKCESRLGGLLKHYYRAA